LRDYERGFGDYDKEFWLGLISLQKIISEKPHELLVRLKEVGKRGKLIFARYAKFNLTGEAGEYRLMVAGHGGSAGDPLSKFNGTAFSAFDADRDLSRRTNCASKYNSGWWFASCGVSNLNGLNYASSNAPEARGVVWTDDQHDFRYSFAETEMMVRPTEEDQNDDSGSRRFTSS